MYPRILKKAFTWAQLHGYCGVEFVEGGEHTWVFLRCWDSSQVRRVCVAILDRFSGDVSEEVVALGRIIDAIGPDVRVVSVQGGPMLFWRRTSTSWAAGISRSWSNTHCSICASLSVVFKRLRPVFLGLWIHTPWQSSSWTGWRGWRVVTGWLLDLRWRRPS